MSSINTLPADVNEMITECSIGDYARLDELSVRIREQINTMDLRHLGDVPLLLNVWNEKRRKQTAGQY